MGMIYFTNKKKRLLLEEIEKVQPHLLSTLINHPGIGFSMVDSKHGPVVLGKEGKIYLQRGLLRKPKIEGKNPLHAFGPNAVKHLLRVHSFATCSDILVNSVYDPATETIFGFEPQCGAHGGLGGPQNHPFVLAPKEFEYPSNGVIGAESIYTLFKKWVQ